MKTYKYLFSAALAALLLSVSIQIDARQKQPALSDEVYPVYFADCFHEEEGLLLHFRWRTDCHPLSQAVVLDEAGNVLAQVPYPENKTYLPQGTKKVYIVAVDKKGRQSEAVSVDMTRTYDELKVNHLEPIRIRKGEKRAEFYLAESGKAILLKGVNYCRITTRDHDTFEPDGIVKGCYDPYDAETMFRIIRQHGYNYVRAFIKTGYRRPDSFGLSGPASTRGISPAYMANFIDFMRRAYSYGIYVLPCFCENEMLSNDYFKALSKGASGQEILFSKDGVKAKQKYMTLFFKYLKKNAPDVINGLAAVTMQNEFHFNITRAPFNQKDGIYKFYDGTQYDMADDAQRRELANHAMDLYYKAMKSTVEKNMPGLPMGEGTFCLKAVAKTYESSFGLKPIEKVKDMRYPMTCLEYLQKDIDFLDWHIYRGYFKGTGHEVFDQAVVNMHLDSPEAQELMKEKPVILGEFGAFKENEHTIEAACEFTQGLIDGAMDFGLKGTCYWTVDTFEQLRIWNLMHHDQYLLKNLHW